jgi:hypothetical protein
VPKQVAVRLLHALTTCTREAAATLADAAEYFWSRQPQHQIKPGLLLPDGGSTEKLVAKSFRCLSNDGTVA